MLGKAYETQDRVKKRKVNGLDGGRNSRDLTTRFHRNQLRRYSVAPSSLQH